MARITSGRYFEIRSLLRAHYGIMFSKMATDCMTGVTGLLKEASKQMVRVALLGAGMIGQVHAEAYATMPGVEVVAVVGLDVERAERIAKSLGAEALTTVDPVLNDPHVDVVDVCLPTMLHAQTTLNAARAGKDIICEKPLALTVNDSQAMIVACQDAGVQLLPAMVVRFFPQYQALARAVRDGAIGAPASCTLVRQGFYPHGAGGWYRDQALSGGIFLDLMIHDFDWALSQFGSADRVFARQNESGGPVPFTQGTATIHHQSGVLTQLTGTWGHPGPFTTAVEIAGNGGLLQYNSRESGALEVMMPVQPEEGGDVPLPDLATTDNPYRTELMHFLAVIAGYAQAAVSAEESMMALDLAIRARESARLGRPVPVSQRAA